MTTYPCGHAIGIDEAIGVLPIKPPDHCPLCTKYGTIEVPTKQDIAEKLSRAYKIKPVFPSGQEIKPGTMMYLAGMNGNWPKRAWELVIDGWHPMRLNIAIRHWVKMKRAKEEAIQMFSLAASAAGCPVATGQRVLHLRLEGFRVKPDADAFDKVVLDALVRSGLLLNDDAVGLLGRMGFEAVISKGKKTTLLIGDVA